MADFILSTDSPLDLDVPHLKKRNIEYVCFHYYLNGKPFLDDMGQTISLEDFYKAMVNGADTKTSQVNVDEYIEYFTPFLEQGKDILHVCLSSGLSGSYHNACIARDELHERFPERKLKIVDSLGASSGFGLILETLADLRDQGKDIDELFIWAENHVLEMHHWFFSTDLTFYIKGGRVSKVSGWFGTVLRICPLLNMNYEGKLIPREKVRTKERVIRQIVDKMEKNAVDGLNYSGKCFISHSNCPKDAQAVADLVAARFKHLAAPIKINNIGTIIGSHAGPGTVALFFWGGRRCD